MQSQNDTALQLARSSLAGYASMAYPSFELARHNALLIQALERVEAGKIRRLMVFMPPQHGKSLLSSQVFPSWYLGRNPRRSIILASYGQPLADGFGRAVRNFLNDPLIQAAFPECRLSVDSSAIQSFNTTAGGSFYAVGRGASITGRGADLLLIDDPLKDSEEARSEVIRRSLKDWFSNVAFTRLRPKGAIVVVQTRWHHDDLAGWLLREHGAENWEVISMPAIAENDEAGRKEGEPLWPEKYDLAELESRKRLLGTSAWAALYQQRPTAEEGAIFKREWFARYSELPPKFLRIVQSWDTAFKTGAQNDYSVGTTWGEAQNGFYLLDRWAGRVEFPELKRRVSASAQQWRPNAILVEDKASGQSLIQELKQSTPFPVLAIKVDADKISRASAASPLVEAGKVFLPQSAPWLADYLYSLLTFPAGVHDDDVDSTTQALNYMRGRSQCLGLTEWMQREQQRVMTPKPQVEEQAQTCPTCETPALQRLPGGGRRCAQCGWQWNPAVVRPAEIGQLVVSRRSLSTSQKVQGKLNAVPRVTAAIEQRLQALPFAGEAAEGSTSPKFGL